LLNVDISVPGIGLLLLAIAFAWLSVKAATAAAKQLGIPPALASAGASAIAHGLA
jgi:hypothetical protein